MKGLLIKDFCFIFQQTKTFFIIGLMFAVFYFTKGIDSAPFVIGYTTMMGGILVLSTLGYDDYENSSTFLMTLPITRKEYVLEKYLFSLICCVGAWLFSSALYLILNFRDFSDLLVMALFILLALLAFEMIIIPVQLKFGSEKGRLVMIGIVIAGMLLVTAGKNLADGLMKSNPETISSIVGKIFQMNPAGILVIAFLAVAVIGMISAAVSTKIIEEREY